MTGTLKDIMVSYLFPVKGSYIALRVMNHGGISRTVDGKVIKDASRQLPMTYVHWIYGKLVADPVYREDHVEVETHMRDRDVGRHCISHRTDKLSLVDYGDANIKNNTIKVWYVMTPLEYGCKCGNDEVISGTLVRSTTPMASLALMTKKAIPVDTECVVCGDESANHKEKGKMLICDGCCKGYHRACLLEQKMTPPPREEEDDLSKEWKCGACEQGRPLERSKRRREKRARSPERETAPAPEKAAKRTCASCGDEFEGSDDTCRECMVYT